MWQEDQRKKKRPHQAEFEACFHFTQLTSVRLAPSSVLAMEVPGEPGWLVTLLLDEESCHLSLHSVSHFLLFYDWNCRRNHHIHRHHLMMANGAAVYRPYLPILSLPPFGNSTQALLGAHIPSPISVQVVDSTHDYKLGHRTQA